RASWNPAIVITVNMAPTSSALPKIPPSPGRITGRTTPAARITCPTLQSRRWSTAPAMAVVTKVETAAAAPKIGHDHPNTPGSAGARAPPRQRRRGGGGARRARAAGGAGRDAGGGRGGGGDGGAEGGQREGAGAPAPAVGRRRRARERGQQGERPHERERLGP